MVDKKEKRNNGEYINITKKLVTSRTKTIDRSLDRKPIGFRNLGIMFREFKVVISVCLVFHKKIYEEYDTWVRSNYRKTIYDKRNKLIWKRNGWRKWKEWKEEITLPRANGHEEEDEKEKEGEGEGEEDKRRKIDRFK